MEKPTTPPRRLRPIRGLEPFGLEGEKKIGFILEGISKLQDEVRKPAEEEKED